MSATGIRNRARHLAACLALVAAVAAQVAPGEARAAEDTTERWREALREIGRQVAAEEFGAAEARALALGREMADGIVGGEGADLLLAMVTTYRALAVAGQGRGDEAIWYWQVAQQLFPRIAEIDLGQFGAVGRFLSMHPPRVPGPSGTAEQGTHPADFVPPQRLEAPLPEFPGGRAFRGLEVEVVVQVVIDAEGRPGEPLILAANGEPTLVWATLEALRRWRFRPAQRDGVAVPALYRLTARFVVPDA